MALKHFASQIQDKKVEQVATQSMTEKQPEKQSRLAKLETMQAGKSTIKKPTKTALSQPPNTQVNLSNLNANQANNIEQETNDINPALKEIPLTWSDQQMLCALSAMQIRYGRAAEAIPYLMMIRKINPKNIECCRLLAVAFMRLKRWHEAEAMVEEYDHLQKTNQGSALNGVVLLYRSIVSFKTNKIADAKSWFGKFRSFNKVS